ncbi:hypothetical protein DL95DRAFT_78069 [Leptodontidium sp. 2 PMI_412]|nr:hypothetical protein DL95DRAFT_78069 [Leptodontidium sp. 2 PMI_412]
MDDEELTANTTQAVEPVSGDPPDLDQPRHENALESSLRDRDIETEMRDGSLTQEQQKKLIEQLERGNVPLDDEPLVPELTRPKPTAIQELDAISSHLRNTLVPLCRDFSSLPDTSPEEREAAHQTLRDRIGDEVLDKLESINAEGDREAKILKRALYSEAQGHLSQLANGHIRELARLMAKYQ